MSTESEDFLGIRGAEAEPFPPDEISLSRRLLLCAIAWVVALVVTAPDPRAIVLLPMFPMGLAALFGAKGVQPSFLILGWFPYLLHAVISLACSKRLWFYLLYAILIVALICNVAGCHKMLHSFSTIN
jgi:hypothetical protein